jgi:hypothetical protein
MMMKLDSGVQGKEAMLEAGERGNDGSRVKRQCWKQGKEAMLEAGDI